MAKTLKAYRVLAELSRQEVADKLHVSLATIQRWENDSSSIKASDLERLAELYNCEPGDFFCPKLQQNVKDD